MLTRLRIFFSIILLGGMLNLDQHFSYAAPSRARGALLFMNYCSGCHSVRYLSWSRMLHDLHLDQDSRLQVTPKLSLSLIQATETWPKIAMAEQDADLWFGKSPPDLSLISKQRGSKWLKGYLNGFYPDQHQRFGVNNTYLPNTMMPNVLESLPGDHQAELADITYFLAYTAEPAVLIRTRLGWFVLGFLLILSLVFWQRYKLIKQ